MDAPVGQLLRQWRTHRRRTQLDLALDTDVSTRHLSFVENGRAQPSRELVLKLAERLDVPLRERNRLLLSAGYAPAHPAHAWGSPDLAEALHAVRELLAAHEPYPALAVDRAWNVLETNAGVDLLLAVVSPALLAGDVNALRLTLHPDGLAPYVTNLAQWRAAVLGALQRAAAAHDEDEMHALCAELAAYPAGGPADAPTPAGSVHVPLRLRMDGVDLSFLSVVSTLGTAVDVTLAEVSIESFLPTDRATADFLRSRVGR